MDNLEIQRFLDSYDYDVRKSHNARWIDQKCTFDVLSFIADCILQYIGDDIHKSFTVRDIWHSEYAVESLQEIFTKPNPEENSPNEYDKFFGQPLKLLGYSKVLSEQKQGRKNIYCVNNIELLKHIAFRETNAIEFLYRYITKVLKDSGIYEEFERFFGNQTNGTYAITRDIFYGFTYQNTPIKGKYEPGRIFTKVINVLAYKSKKLGTAGGFLSKDIITRSDLVYNQKNWRDENSGKPKNISRNDYKTEELGTMAPYRIQKAKRMLQEFNAKYRQLKSEVSTNSIFENEAIHIHHIFPVAEFPVIADYLENLIVLTPNQHLVYAHPNGHTHLISPDYQYICLVCKAARIKENLESQEQEHIYVFDDYMYVLNTGFSTNDFDNIRENDFISVLIKIDEHVGSDVINNCHMQLGI